MIFEKIPCIQDAGGANYCDGLASQPVESVQLHSKLLVLNETRLTF